MIAGHLQLSTGRNRQTWRGSTARSLAFAYFSNVIDTEGRRTIVKIIKNQDSDFIS